MGTGRRASAAATVRLPRKAASLELTPPYIQVLHCWPLLPAAAIVSDGLAMTRLYALAERQRCAAIPRYHSLLEKPLQCSRVRLRWSPPRDL